MPPLYSGEEKGLYALAQVKFFTLDRNWSWYASELDGDDPPGLVRATLKELKLAADDIPENTKAKNTIQRILINLATISNCSEELHNLYGTGYGKTAIFKGL